MVLTLLLFPGRLAVAQGPDQRKLWNDAYARLTAENEAFLPNPFLTKIIVADGNQFDYGSDRYDLVVGMYVHDLVTDRAKDVVASLRRGGLLVVEGFHRDALSGGGHETNELVRVFGASLTVLH